MSDNSELPNCVNHPGPSGIDAVGVILDNPTLSRTEKLVLIGIVRHGLTGATPGNRCLMRYASSRDEETISRAVGRLRRMGLISQRGQPGRRRAFYTTLDMLRTGGVAV